MKVLKVILLILGIIVAVFLAVVGTVVVMNFQTGMDNLAERTEEVLTENEPLVGEHDEAVALFNQARENSPVLCRWRVMNRGKIRLRQKSHRVYF